MDISKLYKRTLTIIHREIERLMEESFYGKLQPQDSKSLIDYHKLVHELHSLDELEKLERKVKRKESKKDE